MSFLFKNLISLSGDKLKCENFQSKNSKANIPTPQSAITLTFTRFPIAITLHSKP